MSRVVKMKAGPRRGVDENGCDLLDPGQAVFRGGERIYHLAFPMDHFGSHSGYHQLTRYLGCQGINLRRGTLIREQLHWRIVRYLVKRAGLVWYGQRHLDAELAVLTSGIRDGVVHILYGEDSYAHLRWWRWRGRARLVCTYHQPGEQFVKAVLRPEDRLRRLDGIIALCEKQANFLQDFVGSDRVYVVPHGVDTDFFCPEEQTLEEGDPPVCLFVGNWLRDFDTLDQVVWRLKRSLPRVRIVAIAPQKCRDRLGGISGLETYYRVDDEGLRRWYRRATALVLPLHDCVANNAVLEAMACGLPVIASAVGGIAEYVDSHCGVLTPKGNAEAMVDAAYALAMDDRLRRSMGRAGRKRAVEYFDWRVVARQMRDIYNGNAK